MRNALSGNRGGAQSGGSGGASDLFNSLRYSGLFNENNGHGQPGDKPKVTVSGAGPGGEFHFSIKIKIISNIFRFRCRLSYSSTIPATTVCTKQPKSISTSNSSKS